MIISSFYTFNAIPAVGLSPLPTIRIWEVDGSTETLVINGASLSEVGDGFYQYLFSTYDPTKEYVFRTDGGTTYASDPAERYQAGSIEVSTITNNTIEDIAGQVWDQNTASHVGAGTFGLLEQQIKADTTAIAANLYVNAGSVLDLVQLIVKYDTNRTKIDPTLMTLTVYEDDCVTPLRVFQLLDTTGTPSITQVAERKPISANDGLPVCP